MEGSGMHDCKSFVTDVALKEKNSEHGITSITM